MRWCCCGSGAPWGWGPFWLIREAPVTPRHWMSHPLLAYWTSTQLLKRQRTVLLVRAFHLGSKEGRDPKSILEMETVFPSATPPHPASIPAYSFHEVIRPPSSSLSWLARGYFLAITGHFCCDQWMLLVKVETYISKGTNKRKYTSLC